MASILDSAFDVLKAGLTPAEGDPPLPKLLQDNFAAIESLVDGLQSVQTGPTGAGIDEWLDKLKAIEAIAAGSHLHDTLVVRALQVRAPRLAELLTLARIILIEFDPGDDSRPRSFSIDWAQIDKLVGTPGQATLDTLFFEINKLEDLKSLQALILAGIAAPGVLLRDLEYQKQGFASLPNPGPPGVDLIKLVQDILSPYRVALPFPQDPPGSVDDLKGMAGPTAEGLDGWVALDGPTDLDFSETNGFGIEVHLKNAQDQASKTIDLGGGWSLVVAAQGNGPQTYRVRLSATGIDPSIQSSADLALRVARASGPDGAFLFGDKDGTYLRIDKLAAGIGLRASGPPYGIELNASPITLQLKVDFLKFIAFGLPIPEALTMASGIDLSFLQGHGLTWPGGAGPHLGLSLQQLLPLGFKIGSAAAGAQIDQVAVQLDVGLGVGGLDFGIAQRFSAKGQFGPLAVLMDGAGFKIARGLSLGDSLIAPTGIGLTLQAGPVDGGGFLKIVNNDEFAGALQLKILGIGAFAYGIYQTLPGGKLSFAALIGIRLPPPGIQISFGFAISGFGGLVGINRRADTDLLRERLASGAAGDVLFNDNPMANAPRLLNDMRQFFPAEDGIFLIGPTLQINWLYLFKLDVGVFIELPGPRKIFIAGSARLVIGSEEFALIYLRMDFIGGIDFTKSLIFFDAALVNSHVLGIFRITGGVALRIAYGDNGYFLFSVGGFHPSFNPGSIELPKVARVGVSFDIGPVWLKQEMYLAITSNTFQLGAKVEAGLDLGVIAAHGWFGFDALIQYKPFYFVGDVDAGFDVEVAGVSLFSVRVHGQLTGPGPLVLSAKASVKILFIRISGSITITLSDNPAAPVELIGNVPLYLVDELKSSDNLRIEGSDKSVQLRPSLDTKLKLFSPVGTLIWEQKKTPLELAIERLGGVDLGGNHTLTVTRANAGPKDSDERDWFGAGTYRKLSDAEALNTGRFSNEVSGLRVYAEIEPDSLGSVKGEATIEIIKKPADAPLSGPFLSYITEHLASMRRDQALSAVMPEIEPQVSVMPEAWSVYPGGGGNAAEPVGEMQAFAAAKATNGVAAPVTAALLNVS